MSFAESVAYICRGIPLTFEGRHVSSQLFRAGTSVAANYRAARRARSRKEFISKIGLVIEEADESLFWLEFAMRIEVLKGPGVERVQREAGELVAILWATRRTALTRLNDTAGKKSG